MPRQPQPAPFDGALVVNKPQGKTSHDVVDAVRHLAGFRQVGHLGTLDPLATGVLVLLLGRATRLVRFYTGRRKRYTAGYRFGFATDTYDSDGEAQGPDVSPTLDPGILERLAADRVGRFEQMPPAFSAKKIHGRPAYELARKKQVVELKPAEVEVFEYKFTGIEGQVARFVIECSSGTYIRALAHEMGENLGCGAHLAEITRTAVGEFSLEQAIDLDELAEAARAGKFVDRLIPLEHLLPNFPRANVLPVVERRVRHGTNFNVSIAQIQPGRVEPVPGATTELDSGQLVAPRLRVFNQQNKLIAIAEAVVPRTYRPIVVFESLP
ncbi:MAG TPA: tRNA pseudouridine(55) synthase TruB [Candidatus Dormibacteraeota bacterium]|nr:tRNA pseudouridine(55) synthase TruB [Candidatus Dormibacteraeota bacterium]